MRAAEKIAQNIHLVTEWELLKVEKESIAAIIDREMNRWISIADRLPKVGEQVVFICNVNGDWSDPEIGRYTGMKTAGDAIVMDCGDPDEWYPCTHFRELPTPPTP